MSSTTTTPRPCRGVGRSGKAATIAAPGSYASTSGNVPASSSPPATTTKPSPAAAAAVPPRAVGMLARTSQRPVERVEPLRRCRGCRPGRPPGPPRRTQLVQRRHPEVLSGHAESPTRRPPSSTTGRSTRVRVGQRRPGRCLRRRTCGPSTNAAPPAARASGMGWPAAHSPSARTRTRRGRQRRSRRSRRRRRRARPSEAAMAWFTATGRSGPARPLVRLDVVDLDGGHGVARRRRTRRPRRSFRPPRPPPPPCEASASGQGHPGQAATPGPRRPRDGVARAPVAPQGAGRGREPARGREPLRVTPPSYGPRHGRARRRRRARVTSRAERLPHVPLQAGPSERGVQDRERVAPARARPGASR